MIHSGRFRSVSIQPELPSHQYNNRMPTNDWQGGGEQNDEGGDEKRGGGKLHFDWHLCKL